MRKSNRPAGGGLDRSTAETGAQPASDEGSPREETLTSLDGGLRLRGMLSRRWKRTLRDDLELVTYTVTSKNGTHVVEDFTPPGGPYLSLGEIVDLEVEISGFTDKKGMVHHRPRVHKRTGEF
jgi:hypothetical protein